MGLVRTTLTLANPKRPDLAPVEVEALVDTGAVHLCVPERIAIQLDLDELERREVTVADGSTHSVPYVGPIVTAFGRRHCYTGAMVLGDEVLLGAIPMEDMDLVVVPMTREIIPNPRSPNVPASIAMGFKSFTKGR
jgi:clan AA aspartic protease